MSKDIGEQFAMMNEVSSKISQKTFDKFVEEAVTEFKQDHDTDKVNGLQVYEFITAKIAEIIDMHYDGEL
jgi:hypothetical protein